MVVIQSNMLGLAYEADDASIEATKSLDGRELLELWNEQYLSQPSGVDSAVGLAVMYHLERINDPYLEYRMPDWSDFADMLGADGQIDAAIQVYQRSYPEALANGGGESDEWETFEEGHPRLAMAAMLLRLERFRECRKLLPDADWSGLDAEPDLQERCCSVASFMLGYAAHSMSDWTAAEAGYRKALDAYGVSGVHGREPELDLFYKWQLEDIKEGLIRAERRLPAPGWLLIMAEGINLDVPDDERLAS